MSLNEIWKPIKGYEGLYEISNRGSIKSLEREIGNNGGIAIKKEAILTPQQIRCGYYRIGLTDENKKRKMFLVHRLVATAFIPNPQNKSEVNHIDGNKKNNNLENLEWCTRGENLKHAYKTNLRTTEASKNNFKKMIEKHKRKVIQKDINQNIINEFKSIKEASKITETSIISVCKHKGYYKTAGGYIWEYGI